MSNTGVKGISWGEHDGKIRLQIYYWNRKTGKSHYKAIYSKGVTMEHDDAAMECAKKILEGFKNA